MALHDGIQVVNVNGIPTRVYYRRETTSSRPAPSSLVMVVTGSPGMAQFYIPFVDHLYELGGGRYEVCVLGQAGHSPGVAKTRDSLGRDWYSLEDQVAHKAAFIEQYTGDKDSLYLIGHSIGCYMILQLLSKLQEQLVKKALFLFPTIDRMSQTHNGCRLYPLFTTFQWPFIFLIWLVSFIPLSIRSSLVSWANPDCPEEHRPHLVRAVTNITPTSMYHILCMAHQEMDQVQEVPVGIIREHLSKLVFYYGDPDPWTMPDSCSNLQQLFPEGDITPCPHGYPHAFVETSSTPMAKFCFEKLDI